jgi:hypothetical protein
MNRMNNVGDEGIMGNRMINRLNLDDELIRGEDRMMNGGRRFDTVDRMMMNGGRVDTVDRMMMTPLERVKMMNGMNARTNVEDDIMV